MNAITDLSPKTLRQAANIKEKIDALQNDLSKLLGSEVSAPARATRARRKKRRLSARGIANIRAGVAKRMAALRGGKGKPVKKARRKMSAAAKARLSALAKARWAKAKKAGRSRL